jgi:hypothetical protein
MANELVFDSTLLDELDNDNTAVAPDFDPDADYNAPPPPLPDGWYLATLECAGVNVDGQRVPFTQIKWKGDVTEKGHFWTGVQAKVQDPGGLEDGKFASDGLVRTKLDPKRHNTSLVASYYRAITGDPIPGTSEGQHMKAILEKLQEKPLVYIKTQLQGGYKKEDGSRVNIKGQDKFVNENGKVTGVVEVDGQRIVGRPAIIDVRNQDFVPPVK